jgi:hypothetical protein
MKDSVNFDSKKDGVLSRFPLCRVRRARSTTEENKSPKLMVSASGIILYFSILYSRLGGGQINARWGGLRRAQTAVLIEAVFSEPLLAYRA